MLESRRPLLKGDIMDVNKYLKEYPHLNEKEKEILNHTLKNDPKIREFEFYIKVAVHCAYQTGYTDSMFEYNKKIDTMLEEMNKKEEAKI